MVPRYSGIFFDDAFVAIDTKAESHNPGDKTSNESKPASLFVEKALIPFV